MRRFYSPAKDIVDRQITLSLEESHHLRSVLRLREGDEVAVFDGLGNEFLCTVAQIGKKNAILRITGSITPTAAESPLDMTLAAAVLKGERYEYAIQKAVELGVKRFVPLITQYCEVKIKDAEKKRSRWERISIDASKQCGRATLMTVAAPLVFADHVAGFAKNETTIMFSERDGDRLNLPASAERISAIVGPTGGWDDPEIRSARNAGAAVVTLGGRIMRAGTALVAITAILQNRFGDIN